MFVKIMVKALGRRSIKSTNVMYMVANRCISTLCVYIHKKGHLTWTSKLIIQGFSSVRFLFRLCTSRLRLFLSAAFDLLVLFSFFTVTSGRKKPIETLSILFIYSRQPICFSTHHWLLWKDHYPLVSMSTILPIFLWRTWKPSVTNSNCTNLPCSF